MNLKAAMNNNDEYQKLFKKLEDADATYKNFVKKLAKYHFQVKAIIQVTFKM